MSASQISSPNEEAVAIVGVQMCGPPAFACLGEPKLHTYRSERLVARSTWCRLLSEFQMLRLKKWSNQVWFRLASRWEKFRWIGKEMDLHLTDPYPLTVRVFEGERAEAEPEKVTNACIETIAKIDCSDELMHQAPGDVESCFFGYFTVEPVNVQEELRTIRYQIARTTIRTANLIRQSVGPLGFADPFRDVSFSYSRDGKTWIEIESIPLFRRVSNFVHSYDETWRQELQAKLDRGEWEPIAHDIFRSAWDARIDNPRASLVLGVAALEVGIKDCIARLIPETTWLVDNLPAPPVADLMGKYLPVILSRRGNMSVFAPPKPLIKRIREAVEHRNTIAHKLNGSERYEKLDGALDYASLEATLWSIDDLLSLFDFYCGDDRSINHLRSETKQLLIDRNNRQELPAPDYEMKHDAVL